MTGSCPDPERKEAGESILEYTAHYDSPLGGITIVSDGEALTGLRFDEEGPSADAQEDAGAEERPVIRQTKKWLDLYFSGKTPDFTPPLCLRATAFRRAVWDIVRTIPYGKTMTYGEIAEIIARQKGSAKMSAQAVGQAVGQNPISIIIPCHRVVGAGGKLTGYAGGLDKKEALLALEGALGASEE